MVLALKLVPFAGIAFLWFIGVIRDRVGQREDRFFATVSLGSGLLFVGMLFVAAAVSGGLFAAASRSSGPPGADTVALGRDVTGLLVNIYSMRMAAVFTLTTVTIARRTEIVSGDSRSPGSWPRWCCWSVSASQPGWSCCFRRGSWP